MFLLAFFLFLAAKGVVAFTAYKVMSTFKEQYSRDFLLTYSWISSDLEGVITIEGLQFTPYTMKKTFDIESLSLHYSDFLSLLLALPSMSKGDIRNVQKISIQNAQSELKGKSLNDLLSEEFDSAWFVPFGLYGCNNFAHLSSEAYQRMGVDKWKASIDIGFDFTEKNNDQVSVSIDQHELGKMTIVSEWSPHAVESFFNNGNLTEKSLFSLEFEYQDSGFFRRLNILCNEKEKEKRDVFSRNAAFGWKNAMHAKGLMISDELLVLYANFLLQGGTLSLSAHSESGINTSNLHELVNTDLISQLDVEITLNEQKLTSAALYIDGNILFPPVIEPEKETLVTADEVTIQPGYRFIEPEQLEQFIGRKVKITMLDEKVYEGLLETTTEYNLELTQNLPGGSIHYPLMRNEIKVIEVWFNQTQI